MLFVAQCITCGSILQANGCADIACEYLLDVFSVVGVHLKDPTDPLVLILCGVIYCRTCCKNARIYSEEAKLTNERVCCDLECKSCERLVIGRRSFVLLACFGVNALDVRNIKR